MISVVIPANNEEAVIGRCLRALTERHVEEGIDIVVACNGCEDATAQIAKAFGPPVRVVEIARASKTLALNHGDRCAVGFPRVFLDADVEVSLGTIEKVAALLRRGDILAAAPSLRVDVSKAARGVRAFYSVWLRLPYHGPGMVGSGFYALSESGRARFDRFPSIIADDEFVRAHFTPEERGTPTDCSFTIRAPRTLSDLIRVKTRSRLGLYELRHRFPHLAWSSRSQGGALWSTVAVDPSLWPATLVYLWLNVVARVRARKQFQKIHSYRWERDDSSRALTQEGGGRGQ